MRLILRAAWDARQRPKRTPKCTLIFFRGRDRKGCSPALLWKASSGHFFHLALVVPAVPVGASRAEVSDLPRTGRRLHLPYEMKPE
jgi:hypothetical protein